MISALKKLSRSSQDSNSSTHPDTVGKNVNGITTLSESLQKKFAAKGVHYNLKLLIRGDRASGKTALFQRLQGQAFVEKYEPTDEIKVTAIQWSHKAADDIVKVEVWDVVDKGKKRIKLEGLKIHEASTLPPLEASLDAEFVDVYKGAHGVVFMFDITKQWTFDYVASELSKVPKSLPILVLGNFVDQGHHRCVTKDQAVGMIESFGELNIRYAESSMRNGFGLRYLHKFISLPYLILQREALERQMELNMREMKAIDMELELYNQSEESDYEKFADSLTKRRRQVADKLAPAPTVDVVVGDQSRSHKISQQKSELPNQPSPKQDINISSFSEKCPGTKPECEIQSDPVPPQTISEAPNAVLGVSQNNSVDTFMPEASAIDFFLNDNAEAIAPAGKVDNYDESSDEDIGGNPMVASVTEDIDLDDLESSNPSQNKEVYEEL